MTPTRFRACLDALHLTQRGLARILNQPEGLVRQWARGAKPIPADVALRLLAAEATHNFLLSRHPVIKV